MQTGLEGITTKRLLKGKVLLRSSTYFNDIKNACRLSGNIDLIFIFFIFDIKTKGTIDGLP